MADSLYDLSSDVVLVTGSSRGIGRAIALELAQAGAHVVVHGLQDGTELESTLTAVRALGVDALGVDANVADRVDVQRLVDQSGRWKGRLDGVVTSAGRFRGDSLEEIGGVEWEDLIRTDLEGTFRSIQAARSWLEKSSHPSIVTVSSVLASHATAGGAAYQAAKAGVEQLTRALALELAPKIRVNCIAPGFIRTDMNRGGHEDPEFSKFIARRTPLGRWGDPEDVAPAARFLLSREAAWATGLILPVDGGIWLR